jgi:hypothetical protein
MTQRRRDDLFREIAGIFPDMTPFGFGYAATVAEIEHRPTCSTFKVFESEVGVSPASFALDWKVTDGPASDPASSCHEWHDVITVLKQWASEVRYITENDDLWAALQRISHNLQRAEDLSDTPFTAEEQTAIAIGIEAITQGAHGRSELTAEQVASIEKKLDDVAEASERLGRKDWLMMLYGAAFAMIVNDTVPPSVVQTALSDLGLDQMVGQRGERIEIAGRTRMQERAHANEIDVAVQAVPGSQAKMLPEDDNDAVHMVVVTNGSSRPVREVTAKIEVIRRDGARFDKIADAYGEIMAYALGPGAQAEVFVPSARASTMPVLARGHKAGFVWPFKASEYPNLLTWVRFTDDNELHWEVDTSLRLERLDTRDW